MNEIIEICIKNNIKFSKTVKNIRVWQKNQKKCCTKKVIIKFSKIVTLLTMFFS